MDGWMGRWVDGRFPSAKIKTPPPNQITYIPPINHPIQSQNSIRERVAEELSEAREEGFALMGPDVDVVEREEDKARCYH